MKPLVIKPSSLDAQVPEGVTVMYRLTGVRKGRREPPPIIGDYDSLEKAQAASDRLTAKREPHEFLTWWRKDGRHVHKWPTLMKGKRRYFRVSVPYVEGVSDEMVKAMIHRQIVTADERPAAYTDKAVRVTIDSEENKTQLIVPLTDQEYRP